MLWSVVFLLAATAVGSYRPSVSHERLHHGRQLKIFLPKTSDRLEFSPADRPDQNVVYWERDRTKYNSRGRVLGTGTDRRWILDMVTYEDQGTYIQTDYWGKEVSTVRVAITPRLNYVKCVAGESLYVSLEGIPPTDATLVFSSADGNLTLVRDGARVSQDLPDYWNRVQTQSNKIQIQNVNVSDEGRYTLRDRRDRVVSVTRMDLTDKHEFSEGNPLLALLLLLGIPAGVCCCCRKKIFKKKAAANVQHTMSPVEAVHPPPGGPVGPCPPYNAPGQPGTMFYQNPPGSNLGPTVHPPPAGPQWTGPPPSPGFNPAYPPANPSYPPANTSYNPAAPMIPPGQPPEWSGPPQGLYPPAGPMAPMGYSAAPVMCSSAPPGAEGEKTTPPATTTPQAQDAPPHTAPAPPSSTTPPTTSDNAFQFQIDDGKNSTNFL